MKNTIQIEVGESLAYIHNLQKAIGKRNASLILQWKLTGEKQRTAMESETLPEAREDCEKTRNIPQGKVAIGFALYGDYIKLFPLSQGAETVIANIAWLAGSDSEGNDMSEGIMIQRNKLAKSVYAIGPAFCKRSNCYFVKMTQDKARGGKVANYEVGSNSGADYQNNPWEGYQSTFAKLFNSIPA